MLAMNQAAKTDNATGSLEAPRFEDAGARVFAGLRAHYAAGAMKGIFEQWMRFGPQIGSIAGQVGRVAYGVCYNVQEKPFRMDYLCAVEVSDAANLPPEFATLSVSPHRYAIFVHPDHVSNISRTVDLIFHSWLPASGHLFDHTPQDGLAFFERYGENFDPRSGTGDIQIWVPLKE
jgi:AraC family transcriptional regulator